MKETRDLERVEEMEVAALSICEGAKTLTKMLVEKYKDEHDLLQTIVHEMEDRGIRYKRLPHLDDRLNIQIAITDLLGEIDKLRRGILPSDN